MAMNLKTTSRALGALRVSGKAPDVQVALPSLRDNNLTQRPTATCRLSGLYPGG